MTPKCPKPQISSRGGKITTFHQKRALFGHILPFFGGGFPENTHELRCRRENPSKVFGKNSPRSPKLKISPFFGEIGAKTGTFRHFSGPKRGPGAPTPRTAKTGGFGGLEVLEGAKPHFSPSRGQKPHFSPSTGQKEPDRGSDPEHPRWIEVLDGSSSRFADHVANESNFECTSVQSPVERSTCHVIDVIVTKNSVATQNYFQKHFLKKIS